MGIYASRSSIAIFSVAGDLPQDDLEAWIGEHLRQNAFMSIDNTADQESFGWVAIDDADDSEFLAGNSYRRDNYYAFSLRRDQRKVPAILKKREFQALCDRYLAENPTYKKVPKQTREEYSELATSRLLSKTLPVPSLTDAVWNSETNQLYLFATTNRTVELFEALFKASFPGLRLLPQPPVSWARELTPEPLQGSLKSLTAELPESMTGQISGAIWLAEDFFRWLLTETIDGSGEFVVSTPGLAGAGTPFVAYLNNRVVVKGSADSGEKLTVTGDQGTFHEVRTGLLGGKQISEAALMLELDEMTWGMTLKGELFHFGGFATPPPAPKDGLADEGIDEQEALFYEKIALIEKGLQLFASLFVAYLNVRLSDGWESYSKKTDELLAG